MVIVECIEINSKTFFIDEIISKNRHAHARLKEDRIVISLPSRWPANERNRIAANLRKRAIRAIELGKWKADANKKTEFSNGQKLQVMGREIEVRFTSGNVFRSKIVGSRIIDVGIVESHPHKNKIASRIVKKRIIEYAMPRVLERINSINDEHFQAEIPKVSIRDTVTRWGSCSRDGAISLSFKLLFMPESILDYVIVHELAHTQHRNHGVRFWTLVEKIVPDHKERRAWLRKNGSDAIHLRKGSCGCRTTPDNEIDMMASTESNSIADFVGDEPY